MDKLKIYNEIMGGKNHPENLYHYTDRNGFLGLIKNREFWASHISYQNDMNEAQIALEIFEKQKEMLSPDEKEKFGRKYLLGWCGSDFLKTASQKGIFTVSFTTEQDDLNQWRGYANDRPGFSVGFKTSALLRCLKNGLNEKYEKGKEFYKKFTREQMDVVSDVVNQGCESAEYDKKTNVVETVSYSYSLLPCIYDENEQYKLIEKVINLYLFETANRKDTSSKIKPDYNPVDLALNLMVCSAIFKDKHFASEKEWRLFIYNVQPEFADIRVSNKRVGFIPFCHLPFNNIDCIKDITFGPIYDSDATYNSTLFALKLNGIDCVADRENEKSENGKYNRLLRKTRIPYRSW